MADRKPSDDKAAFGVYPQMRGKRSRQDPEAAKNVPVDLARGFVAGALGMPGDIESLVRMLPYLDEKTFLPTSEDVLKRIPLGSDSPAGRFASGLGTLIGGSAPVGPAIQGVKALPGALQTATRNLSAPRTLNPQAGVVRVGQPSAPQMEALRLAQKRAALPIEQGGLGLPANNTPEQRAAAMGFDRDTYHGSLRDIKKLDPRLGSTESHAGRGVYSTDSPEDASLNYASIYGPDVSGRVERGLEERDKDFRKIYGRMRDEVLTPRQQEIILRNAAGADNLGVVYPLRVRSDKSIHLDAPEANPVRVGPFEQYDEATGTYIDTPHTEKFREALDEFGELGGEANPIYEVVQDGDGPVPARDVFNAVKKTGNETGLYDPYTGDIVSGGVAAGDFVKHFGIDEIRHTPEFRNQQLNIGNEHTISLNPDNVRSRFAAFDPFRKDVATAAAMGVLAPDLLAKEKDKDKNKDKESKKEGGVVISNNPDTMMLEVNNKRMQAGGLAKGLKALVKTPKKAVPLIEAPSVIIPSGISSVKEALRKSEGAYGVRRIERAADEVKNLEKLYNEKALREAFLGDNAKAVVTMNPADFEKYAQELRGRTRADIGPKAAELAKQGEIDKYTVPTDEYIQHLMRVQGGFDQVPYLNLYKDEVGIPSMPEVRGHEGRHRSRALSEAGESTGLVQISPRGDLREGLPRRSQEEYIEALREELERSGRLVLPEVDGSYRRPAVELPEPYAEGGAVHMQAGGAIKSLAKTEALAKLAKLREEMAPRADAVKNLIAKDENKYLSDVTPNSLTKAEIEAEIARMKARMQPEVKKAGGGAIDYNTTPDMSDGGGIIRGEPFKQGGKVKMTANRDAMFLELSNKKLKRK
jgi:hypothetical protein